MLLINVALRITKRHGYCPGCQAQGTVHYEHFGGFTVVGRNGSGEWGKGGDRLGGSGVAPGDVTKGSWSNGATRRTFLTGLGLFWQSPLFFEAITIAIGENMNPQVVEAEGLVRAGDRRIGIGHFPGVNKGDSTLP